MDFPMTAGISIDLQSSPATDSASATQATGSDRFSSHYKNETSQRNDASNSTNDTCRGKQCNETAKADDPQKPQETARKDGNELPADGKDLPEEQTTSERDTIENELEQLEAQLEAELANTEATAAAAPLQADVAAKSSPAAVALQSLQKQLAGDTPRQANPQVTGLGNAGLDSASLTPATGSPAALDAKTTAPVASTEVPEELAITANKTEELSTEDALAKLAEQKLTAEPKLSTGNGQPVSIVTALNELGRPAFSTTAAQAPSVPQAATTLNQTALSQSMGNSVQWMLKENLQEANIRVKPSELGPINIKLSMNNDQLSMSLNAAHAATREALEASLPKVREAFAASNLNLGNVDVSDQQLPQHQQGSQLADYSGESADEYIRPFVPDEVDPALEEEVYELTTALGGRETAGVLDLFA